MSGRCGCACHHGARADVAAGEPIPWNVPAFNPGADTRDPLAAAIACDACRARHCPALLTPRAVPPRREKAELPAELRGKDYVPPAAQADGEGGE